MARPVQPLQEVEPEVLSIRTLWRYCVWSQLGGGLLGALLFIAFGHRFDLAGHFFIGALLGLLWLANLKQGATLEASKGRQPWRLVAFSILRMTLTSVALVVAGLGSPGKTVIVLLGFLSYKVCLLALAIKSVIKRVLMSCFSLRS